MFDLLELRKLIGISASEFSEMVDIPQQTLEDSHRKSRASIRSLETAAYNLGWSLIDTMMLSYVEDDEPLGLFEVGTSEKKSIEEVIPDIDDMVVYHQRFAQPITNMASAHIDASSIGVRKLSPRTVIAKLVEASTGKSIYIRTDHPSQVIELFRRRVNMSGEVRIKGVWYASRKRDMEYELHLCANLQSDISFTPFINRQPGYLSTATTMPLIACSKICRNLKYCVCKLSPDDKDPIPVGNYCDLGEIIARVVLDTGKESIGSRRYQYWERLGWIDQNNIRHTMRWTVSIFPSAHEIVSRMPGCIAIFRHREDPGNKIVNIFNDVTDMVAYLEEDPDKTYQLVVYWCCIFDLDCIFTKYREVLK